MECTDYHILITGYLDHELSDAELHQLKPHLQTCEACMTHLRKMEQTRTALHRFQLVQDIPDASPHFARNVTRMLQETTPAPARLAFAGRAIARYRAFVLRLVERWIASLRARPVTWVTSVSCALIVIAGMGFLNLNHTLDRVSQDTLMRPVPTSIALNRPPVAAVNTLGEGQPAPTAAPMLVAVAKDESAPSETAGFPDFIRFSDEPVVQIAKTTVRSDSYVYAHIVEASQEQFLDNAVFAGYVQDALFQ